MPAKTKPSKPSGSVKGHEPQNAPRLSTVSFFCGCGGLDLGFHGGFSYRGQFYPRTAFDTLAAYDVNEKAIETYRKNIDQNASVKDLSTFEPAEMPQAQVLIGGFPCQDFSSCGPQSGLNSERGRLYKSLISYMEHHQPMVVVAENVLGLATIHEGRTLKTIHRDLEAAGYHFEIWTLYAPDYGVPQTRTRLFLVGVRNDIEGAPVKPVPRFVGRPRTIEWAIGDLTTVSDSSVPNQEQYFKATKAKNGNGQGDEISKVGEPGYTVRANAKSRVQFHYELDRRLTIRECARLQTFPDNFVFPHAATTNIMQIGNAVPPLLANIVANSVEQFLTDHER